MAFTARVYAIDIAIHAFVLFYFILWGGFLRISAA